jgi:pectate lyase
MARMKRALWCVLAFVCLGCSSSGQSTLLSGACELGSVPAPGSMAKPARALDGSDCSVFMGPHDPPRGLDEQPAGWASVDDLGQIGTNGGLGGEVVLATTIEQLEAYGMRAESLIIEVCGTLGTGLEELGLGSNKTIVGVGASPTIAASFDIDDAHNIVIKNLFVRGANPDGIALRRSHHVWIDHVDIADSSDGNLDVTDQSNYVTISYSKFWYSTRTQQHRFSNLIGSGDDNLEDRGLLKVTLHHNWWADNVTERMPRARYGDIHVFNNYYSSSGNNYCIQAGREARMLVEGNYFTGVKEPLVIAGGELVEQGNVFDGTVGVAPSHGAAFQPPYAYQLEDPCSVPVTVMQNAGPL